jgi:hypothetical protein
VEGLEADGALQALGDGVWSHEGDVLPSNFALHLDKYNLLFIVKDALIRTSLQGCLESRRTFRERLLILLHGVSWGQCPLA